jgi:hypothetical protein
MQRGTKSTLRDIATRLKDIRERIDIMAADLDISCEVEDVLNTMHDASATLARYR